MPDQTCPSRSLMTQPEMGRRRGEPERSASRAVGAAIVAGGLAFSVSLYPLPGEWQRLELFPPKHELSELPKLADAGLLNRKLPDFSTLQLPDFVKLVEQLNHNFPDLRTDALLDLVTTYGLPDLVRSLELMKSLGSLTLSFPGFFGGGGGGGGGSVDVPPNVLPALVMLLEFLKQNLPDSSGHGLSVVLTNVAQALGTPLTPAGPLPEAEVSTFAESAVSAPAQAVVSAPTEAVVSAPAQAVVSAPTEAVVSAPTQSVVSAPTEAVVSAPTQLVVSAPTEAPVSAPDLPNSGVESPSSAPAGSPSSAAAGSPSGAAAGSPSGAAAGSPSGAPAGSPSCAAAGSPSGAAAGSPSGAAAGSPSGAAAGSPSGAPAGSPS
jgi:hypothetical protein